MRIETFRGLNKPLRVLEGDVVLVSDDYGNPLAVVVKYGANQHLAAVVGDPGFDETLRNLGIDRTVVVDVVTPTLDSIPSNARRVTEVVG